MIAILILFSLLSLLSFFAMAKWDKMMRAHWTEMSEMEARNSAKAFADSQEN